METDRKPSVEKKKKKLTVAWGVSGKKLNFKGVYMPYFFSWKNVKIKSVYVTKYVKSIW